MDGSILGSICVTSVVRFFVGDEQDFDLAVQV